MKRASAKRRLRLESLEIRALLAADAGSDLAHALAAVQVPPTIDAAFASGGNQLLELTGHDTEALIINLDQLPAFVTKLSLSHFASVTMLGSDPVDILMASDVGSLVAPNLNISHSATSGVYLHNVGAVELASAGAMLVLTGEKTDLTVRSLDETTVYSDLKSLTVKSESQLLSIESWNADQNITLGYHPASVAVSGVASAAIRFSDEPLNPSTAVNGSESNSSTLGSSNDQSGLKTDTIIVLDGLKKNTPAFIAELREAERTSSKDSQRLMLQFLNHSAPEVNDTAAIVANVPLRHLNVANLRDLDVAQQAVQVSADVIASEQLNPSVEAATPELGQRVFSDAFTDRPLQVNGSDSLGWSDANASIEIDATWPVAVPTDRPTQTSQAFVPLGSISVDLTEPKLEDSLRAFTDYVVDRVAAEFSPGQQSLVLLVDPKPTRSGAVNQNSALDLFGSRTRTSIASLRQVMS
jgi:hypothetical protein